MPVTLDAYYVQASMELGVPIREVSSFQAPYLTGCG